MNIKGGYAGYYNDTYLRSAIEYAYAYYLDRNNIDWKYELETFNFEGFSYKPDFYIYENGDLKEVVEVKGYRYLEESLEKLESLKEISPVPVSILTEKDIRKLYLHSMDEKYEDVLTQWKESEHTTLNGYDMRGELNPMFGKTHSDETKELISEKAKKRYRDVNSIHRKLTTDKMIAYNEANNYKHAKKPRSKRVELLCEGCNKHFVVTESESKNRKYCNHECFTEHNKSRMSAIGKAEMQKYQDRRDDIKIDILKWADDNKDKVLATKLNRIKNTFQDMYDMIEDKYGITDNRTISTSLFGEDRGRKEMVKYLQEYVQR